MAVTNIQCELETTTNGKGHFTFTGTVGPNDSKVCTRIAPGRITTHQWIKGGGCKNGGELIVNDNIIRFKCACTKWMKDCNIDHTLVFDYVV
ncbi:unnamed protein product [Rotaria sp. Silwood2]|nr:unnamed protein product [Rotaria sp. Silwood2]CAF3391892.1 unnamed protein product [Rotaria sp. Silwood2]CAF3492014.1 unnamed protein product [Rotaria sp. Silwood2]CAF4337337.1 unnamed protein product [Rotaria sp. Silwood2]CAF4598272.1 unnamed protein product [Rotaria sp. Silwood2]